MKPPTYDESIDTAAHYSYTDPASANIILLGIIINLVHHLKLGPMPLYTIEELTASRRKELDAS